VTILEWNRLELTSCPPSLKRSRPSLARGWLTRYLRRDYGELDRSFGIACTSTSASKRHLRE
jgi:hypothetical protein